MVFLLAVLGFIIAEEVVQLEAVNAGTNNFKCNGFDTTTSCNLIPYCHWLSTNEAGKKCIDDPCVASGVQDADLASCAIAESVQCVKKVVTASVLAGDCVGGTGTFCGSPDATDSTYDYCFWARLRDGKCPDSVCEEVDSKCVPNHFTECQFLSTKTECGLTPKCVWTTSGTSRCLQDPCFVGSLGKSCGGAFIGEGWIETLPTARESWQTRTNGDELQPADCVLYQPYKSEGGTANYCVYKDNSAANKCYFLKTNASSNTDYTQTYPTYSSTGKKPTCEGAITGCDTQESGECSTKWNPTGAFAGQYCGDATHGGTSLLGVPSVLVLLISVFFSLLAL